MLMPIPFDGVQTYDDMAGDKDNEEENQDEIDVFGSAYLSKYKPRSSSLPPDYSPSPYLPSDNTAPASSPWRSSVQDFSPSRLCSSPSPASGSTSASYSFDQNLVGTRFPLFMEDEMRFRAAPDLDAVDCIRVSEELEVFAVDPDQHPLYTMNPLPPRLERYRNTRPLSLYDQLDFFDTAIGKSIQALASTDGLIPGAFRTLVAGVHLCSVCNCVYSTTAFMGHVHNGRCMNSIAKGQVNEFISTDPHVERRLTSMLKDVPTSHAPKRDTLWSLTGMLFLMWNSPLGLPVDVWAFARTAVITCKKCSMVRTFDADRLHRVDGKCSIHTVFDDAPRGEEETALVLYKGKGKA
ncbi:hypothetical protein V5O48_010433 [Marasmius crinis-equi]|uniref:Uncharacterized protein n=1 Tax=Marasmius crinis-equi TaxID=585013 RepID=A0ABR3F8E6_9AGAR